MTQDLIPKDDQISTGIDYKSLNINLHHNP